MAPAMEKRQKWFISVPQALGKAWRCNTPVTSREMALRPSMITAFSTVSTGARRPNGTMGVGDDVSGMP